MSLINFVKYHPVPVAIIGFGLGWLMTYKRKPGISASTTRRHTGYSTAADASTDESVDYDYLAARDYGVELSAKGVSKGSSESVPV